jgi:hypothetical protein
MASTYTTNLKLTKQGDGENPNSWGQILNDGVISLLDDAIAGYQTITIGAAATVTLTNNQGGGDQARSAILEFNGSVGGAHNDIVVLVPNNSKSYIVKNSVSYNDATDTVILRVVGNAGVTLEPANTALYVTNGTTVLPVANNTFTNITATSIATSTLHATSISATNIVATSLSVTGLTVATSALFVDNAKANFGTGSDLQVYHDGSHSYITEAGTGVLYVRSSQIWVQNAAGTENMLTANENGAVDIYFDNALKIRTSTAGVGITGNMVASGNVTAYSAAEAKMDIQDIANPLDLVEKLRGVSFEWREQDKGNRTLGFIYEEVKDAIPELTRESSAGVKGVMYQNATSLLVEAVKELSQKVKDLESK